MAEEKQKLPEPELTNEGVKIAVGADEWVEYDRRGWLIEHSIFFENCSHAQAFKMLLEHARDWRVLDENSALVPFNRQGLLLQYELVARGIPCDFPRIVMDKQQSMVNSIATAMREVRKNPLRDASNSLKQA